MNYIDIIEDYKKIQNNCCSICEKKLEKCYVDMDEDLFCHSVTCLDCYTIISSSEYDVNHLINVVKYLRKRDKTISKNFNYLQSHQHKEIA